MKKTHYIPAPLTADERFAVILGELAEALAEKKREIAKLLEKVDDLAQELAVTQSQLEEARAKLAGDQTIDR